LIMASQKKSLANDQEKKPYTGILIRLLRHTMTPDREPLLPQIERLRVILEKLEFAISE